MKIKSNRRTLEKILDIFNPTIDSTNPFPALLGLYFDVNESTTTIISSNGDVSIKHKIVSNENFKIIEPGILLIPSSLFRNIIKKIDGEVFIRNEGLILYLENEGNIYTINCLESENYPKIDFNLIDHKKVVINSSFIRDVIKNVSFASSSSETNNLVLSGVNFNLNLNKIIATATDSFRLAQESSSTLTNGDFNITITAKNLRDLFSNLNSEKVELLIDEYKINIIDENTIFQAKLINMPYIDVTKIIPKNFEKKLYIEKRVLNNYLNKAMVVLNERYSAIDVSISNEEIIFTSQRKEVGATKLVLKNDSFTFEGTPIKIRLNSRFIKEAINVFENNIEILMNSSEKPVLIKDKDSFNNLQLISPLRIN
ncbi:DNA polymerase III subunit beta [[Mycoplasma] mobile]|uniref:DNA polymerase III beta chain n=1 Tax=Mycoplasma mobile (strain ATCC 43663 / 163K / NCTC 11711) TaxID=267748 RepID=Q6KIT6_MYCM1|nr:DNA polymerase III subunit beta [[Mycoplasma] mobile]AAT27488.1 DNA polymerase III beta chain [Mycoplasma mobile 163K]